MQRDIGFMMAYYMILAKKKKWLDAGVLVCSHQTATLQKISSDGGLNQSFQQGRAKKGKTKYQKHVA